MTPDNNRSVAMRAARSLRAAAATKQVNRGRDAPYGALPAIKRTAPVADQACGPVDRCGIDPVGVKVGLGAGHKESPGLMHMEAAAVDIPAIHRVDGSGLRQRHIERMHIAQLAVEDVNKVQDAMLPRRSRNVCILPRVWSNESAPRPRGRGRWSSSPVHIRYCEGPRPGYPRHTATENAQLAAVRRSASRIPRRHPPAWSGEPTPAKLCGKPASEAGFSAKLSEPDTSAARRKWRFHAGA